MPQMWSAPALTCRMRTPPPWRTGVLPIRTPQHQTACAPSTAQVVSNRPADIWWNTIGVPERVTAALAEVSTGESASWAHPKSEARLTAAARSGLGIVMGGASIGSAGRLIRAARVQRCEPTVK